MNGIGEDFVLEGGKWSWSGGMLKILLNRLVRDIKYDSKKKKEERS
jgi:hypothetical protein